MTRWIDPDIGTNYDQTRILLTGRDPGRNETREGKPFVGRSGRLLMNVLKERGLRRKDVAITNVVGTQPPNNNFNAHNRADVERGLTELRQLIERLGPNIIVALGNEASWALVPDWPGGTIYAAKGIEDYRGYIWRSGSGRKVLTTIHPAAADRQWSPYRTLLSYDIAKAKDEAAYAEIRRPTRDVEVVDDPDTARALANTFREWPLVSADIEITGDNSLACIGFSTDPDSAYVFTPPAFEAAFDFLEDPAAATLWQNGQFDLHFLETRCGVHVANYEHDTIIGFHATWPELAGASENKSSKRTHKSLAFLASLYTTDRYWKNYQFSNDREMYELNGLDCCITLDCHREVQKEIDRLGVRDIYEHELSLVWPVVEIQARGLLVNEQERRSRLSRLHSREDEIEATIIEAAEPLLRDRRDRLEKPHLIFREKTCDCCRNGSAKRSHCWSCAGFDSAPTKSALAERFGNPDDLLKDELEVEVLEPCEECGGEGKWEEFSFNPGSNDQKKDLLYNVLKLPRKYSGGSVTVDEDALKMLVGNL